eukprot:gene6218-6934_t
MSDANIGPADWVVIACYFCFCIGLGIWSKFRKQGKKEETAESYFLAGRSMAWWAVGGSLFASNIGSEHFIGLAGSGAATGIGVVAYEWQASWILLLLGFFFVPIYLRAKIFTMPEYLKHRFQSKYMRAYMTVVSLLSYVTTKISVDMYAGGVFMKEAMGWNIYVSSAIILTITALYTLLGGLTAVIYTDVLQCTIMIAGAIGLSAVGFSKLGGLDELWKQYPTAVGASILNVFNTNTTNITSTVANITATVAMNMTNNSTSVDGCYKVDPHWSHMFRPIDDPNYPWIGLWFSLPVTGIWYWCTDQVIVQRTLGAKDIGHARGGTILAGFLKILPMYIMVMPGMISRVLFKDAVGCADPASCLHYCNNKFGCSNTAYPKLVLNILPTGAVGLMLAVMLAALMSSLSSAFNSSSTIFTVDIWKIFRPKASEREQLIVGRIVVVILVVIGFVWIPVVSSGHGGQLFVYLQTIQSYLAPPACAVFLVGMLWPGLTEIGALSSMIFGLILGIVRLAFDVAMPAPHCGEIDNRPGFVKLHFMYYAIVIFASCMVLMIFLSFFTPSVSIEDLGALTWPTINNPRYRSGRSKAEYTVSTGDQFDMDRVTNAHGQAGEEKHQMSADSVVHSKATLTNAEDGKGETEEKYDREKELMEIADFENQNVVTKWAIRGCAIALLCVLAFMWAYYR